MIFTEIDFFVFFCSGEQQEIYLDEAQRLDPEEAKAAIFYSIVTTQPGTDTSADRPNSSLNFSNFTTFMIVGLKGVDLPHQLIKWTSRHLHQQYKGAAKTEIGLVPN
jgi:hypothetical protein